MWNGAVGGGGWYFMKIWKLDSEASYLRVSTIRLLIVTVPIWYLMMILATSINWNFVITSSDSFRTGIPWFVRSIWLPTFTFVCFWLGRFFTIGAGKNDTLKGIFGARYTVPLKSWWFFSKKNKFKYTFVDDESEVLNLFTTRLEIQIRSLPLSIFFYHSRITSVGLGPRRPWATGCTPSKHILN